MKSLLVQSILVVAGGIGVAISVLLFLFAALSCYLSAVALLTGEGAQSYLTAASLALFAGYAAYTAARIFVFSTGGTW